ncbi:DUF309 domain-containing protein [Cohnella nanjingensis]|uniref:DUF309 domain-containing protein n=1 Tax=Cohnella nanjingensis TaxID=1387779 RepID=A0A7X0RMP6_9BACL|nr:DUF309 domain-containing protein [Cohnella nanjingensis]MBB6669136.1 DUF309 domain-containing protein [Cohnella nanjingensis]
MKLLFPFPPPFVDYLAQYHGTRDYFECHEIMEEYWKQQGPVDARYIGCWLVLIRLSVMQYHARRSNGKGAFKLLAKCAAEIDSGLMDEIGLDGERLAEMIRARLAAWGGPEGVRYDDFDLPIREPGLLEAAKRRTSELGAQWSSDGLAAGAAIVNRHKLRDRSDVEEARMASAKRKALGRQRVGEDI